MMDVIVVNLVREGINKHRARELAEHFIKHMTQTEQEPVGEVQNERGDVDWISFVPAVGTSLYTSPPQRQWVGLTDEEIDKTHETQVWDARRSYARAIEAKLKEKNHEQ